MSNLVMVREETFLPLEVLNESVDGQRHLYVEGIMAQANLVNKNKRKYAESTLRRAVESYNDQYVLTNRAIGELNHPGHPKPNPERASHLIKSLVMEGSNAIGKALVIEDVPCGKILAGLIRAGVNMGMSTRGAGVFVKESAGVTRVDNYRMFAIDAVHDPSAHEAFVRGVMEGVEDAESEGLLTMEDLDHAYGLSKLEKPDAVRAFAAFLSKISAG